MLKKTQNTKKPKTPQTQLSEILLAYKRNYSLFWDAVLLNTFKRHICLEVSPSAMLYTTH